MSQIAQAPEFELDAEDAKKLGDAVAGVLAFHKIKMTPKQEAYALLMEAAAQVYPPMIVTLYMRLKMERDKKPKPPAAAPKAAPAPAPRPAPAAPPAQPIRAPLQTNGMPVFDPLKIELPQ